ncbi:uncharacterized protein BJ212DRAFT_1488290 [Suillus subaureus]|uniref:Uncharacterized protein n=1 Tax=Suillus subaureus TaxID=48587 RepID=A0A9P7DP42_9AGAM|nr:uncharacterized protein BJ212DRAFT_1488290 [Suillus subaureus]KAG1799573.1 hypothetical protein BJ212DRAFT_1488290 [Suillus subaureus]
MSTKDTSCCTLLDAQVKRRTKAQKAANDLAIKEAKEAAVQKRVEHLTGMQVEMEKAQKGLLTKKQPHALDDLPEADVTDNHQEAASGADHGTSGKEKKATVKRSGKMLIRDTISNVQKKITTLATQPQTPILLVPAKITDDIPEDALTGSFADEIDDSLEHKAACFESKQNKGKSKVASIFDNDSDFEGPKAPFMQILPIEFDSEDELVTLFSDEGKDSQEPTNLKALTTRTLKCKASADSLMDDNKESVTSKWSMDIDHNAMLELAEDLIEDSDGKSPQPEPIVIKKEKVVWTTTSTSTMTSIADGKLVPVHKKVKVESSGTVGACGTAGSHAAKFQQNVDTIPEQMKTCSAYHTVNLPSAMQANQHWVKKFLPTIMLWAGSYEDIWIIPDDVLLHHAQLVFDAVYKELNIALAHGGMVHLLTVQCISEWRTNFGSTAIVIVMDFMTWNSDCAPSELITSLLNEWAFLFENPDSPSPLIAYCSPFILQLFGTAHLNTIKGYVNVPSFDMHALATSGMSQVLALSAIAVEHALKMIKKKELKVQDVLSLTSQGKATIKLPKVLNKIMRKESSVHVLFSAALWSKPTKAFTKSILSKPAGYVEATIEMARATASDVTETPVGSFDNVMNTIKHTLFCDPLFTNDRVFCLHMEEFLNLTDEHLELSGSMVDSSTESEDEHSDGSDTESEDEFEETHAKMQQSLVSTPKLKLDLHMGVDHSKGLFKFFLKISCEEHLQCAWIPFSWELKDQEWDHHQQQFDKFEKAAHKWERAAEHKRKQQACEKAAKQKPTINSTLHDSTPQ